MQRRTRVERLRSPQRSQEGEGKLEVKGKRRPSEKKKKKSLFFLTVRERGALGLEGDGCMAALCEHLS